MKLTYHEWEKYASDLKAHELFMQEHEPQRDDFIDSVDYHTAHERWKMECAMTAPNKPGYYRANND